MRLVRATMCFFAVTLLLGIGLTGPALAQDTPLAAKQDIYAFDPNILSAHAASLATLPDGTLFATWFAGTREGAEDVAIYGARKLPGEIAWSYPFLVHDTPGKSDGNSVLWYDDERGRLWLFFVTMEGENWKEAVVKKKFSEDGGRTWSQPEYIREEWGWMAGEPLVELSNGDILLPLYDEGGLTGPEWSSMVYVSRDRGETWEVFPKDGQLRSPRGSIQPNVVELRDRPGHLLMVMRTRDGWVYKSESWDFGRTWTEPEKTDIPNNNSRVSLTRLQSGALALVFNPVSYSGGPRNPLRIALSYDEGRTWPLEFQKDIENGPGLAEYSYPWITQGPDGNIHVVYTYQRTRIRYAVMNESFIRDPGLLLPVPTKAHSAEEELELFRQGKTFLPWTVYFGG